MTVSKVDIKLQERKAEHYTRAVAAKDLEIRAQKAKREVLRSSRQDRIEKLERDLSRYARLTEKTNNKLFNLRNKPEKEEAPIKKKLGVLQRQRNKLDRRYTLEQKILDEMYEEYHNQNEEPKDEEQNDMEK